MRSALLVAAAGLLPSAFAQLSVLRGTFPGALHQCEATNGFFFQTGGDRPLQLVFVPSTAVTSDLNSASGTTVDAVQAAGPDLVISDITAADAASFDFTVGLAAGSVVEAFAFLPDGSGKALSLTRTIMTPLPGATNCLSNVNTQISGAQGAAAAPAPVTTTAAGSAGTAGARAGAAGATTTAKASSTRPRLSTSTAAAAASTSAAASDATSEASDPVATTGTATNSTSDAATSSRASLALLATISLAVLAFVI